MTSTTKCSSRSLQQCIAMATTLAIPLFLCGCDEEGAPPAAQHAEAAEDASARSENDGGALQSQAGSTCTFDVAYELSDAISTVVVVTWSVDRDVESATIEFWPVGGGRVLSAPVDLALPNFRTLLLGMKGDTDYEFRISSDGEEGRCSSESYSITTEPVPNAIPRISVEHLSDQEPTLGFVVTSFGLGNLGGFSGQQTVGSLDGGVPGAPPGGRPMVQLPDGGVPRGGPPTGMGFGPLPDGGLPPDLGQLPEDAIVPGLEQPTSDGTVVIFDQDGDIVWYWQSAPAQTSRALMDWEGQLMWMLALNVSGGMGDLSYVSMDGLSAQSNLMEISDGHHDFTVAPNGVVAVISHLDRCSGILERAADGAVTTILADVSDVYQPVGNCHPNSILYHPDDDSYTISDRNPNLYVKVSRRGELLWQLGGSNPRAAHFAATWSVNHGHQLLGNGNFLVFNNGNGGVSSPSRVIEFALDYDEFVATEVWSYESEFGSGTLGDVQRLDSGNTVVTYSNSGVIQEVDPAGEVVVTYRAESLGYAMHRSTLYGAPPK